MTEEKTLPTQIPSSEKIRGFTNSDLLEIGRVQTCLVTSANYGLYFTGRIPFEGMGDKIDTDTEHLLRSSGATLHGNEYKFGYNQVRTWLAEDLGVPTFTLFTSPRVPSWRDYLRDWIEEGGVAINATGGHARLLKKGSRAPDILELDPLSVRPMRINLDDRKDTVAPHIILIPPKSDNLSEKMKTMIQEQVRQIGNYKDIDDVHFYEHRSGGKGIWKGIRIGPVYTPRFMEVCDDYLKASGLIQPEIIILDDKKELPHIEILDQDIIVVGQTGRRKVDLEIPEIIPQPVLEVEAPKGGQPVIDLRKEDI